MIDEDEGVGSFMILARTTVTYYPTFVEVDSDDSAPLDDIQVDTPGAVNLPASITHGTTQTPGTAILSVGPDYRPEVGWRVRDESTGDTYQIDSVQRVGPLLPGWVANLVLIP